MSWSVCIFHPDLQNFHRYKEVGIIGPALRERGWQVSYATYDTGQNFPDWTVPVHKGQIQEMETAKWWQSVRADIYLSHTWLGRHFDGVLHGQKASGKPVVIKADSDGIVSPTVNPRLYYARARDAKAMIKLVAKGITNVDRRVAANVAGVDGVVIESPEARANLVAVLQKAGRRDLPERVVAIPSPVDLPELEPSEKQDVIVSVGRWEDEHQKNTEVLATVAIRFLSSHPEFKWWIAGSGVEVVDGYLKRAGWSSSRMVVMGPIPHLAVLKEMAKARIIFAPSRYESFGLAVAEGLCSGLSMVGTAEIPSFRYLAGQGRFGTLADRCDAESLLTALNAEVAMWRQGMRDANQIAHYWRTELNPVRIAAQYHEYFEQVLAQRPGRADYGRAP